VSIYLYKYFKSLRGVNPYRRLYLKKFQGAEGTHLCWCLYLENFLRDKKKPKKSGIFLELEAYGLFGDDMGMKAPH
jgi:hypothetical protein